MAVEILILSGARRKERIVLDCRAFQAGCDPNCEVFFDPRHDAAANGRSVKFCLQEGGWYVHGAGGEMWVGTQRIVGATHVRSGDIIRMSTSGPQFSFSIVADAKASPGKTPGNRIVSVLPSEEENATGISQAELEGSELNFAAPAPLAFSRQVILGEMPLAKGRDRQSLVWIGVGLVVGILALLAVRAAFFPSSSVIVYFPTGGGTTSPTPVTPPVSSRTSPDNSSVKTASQDNRASEGAKKADSSSGDGSRARVEDRGESKKSAEQPRPAMDLRAQLDGAVCLIVVEKGDHYWSHATCVAVGKNTLLTTAYDAMDLAKMRDEDKFKIWVTRPADNSSANADDLKFKFKAEAQDIRVLAPYAELSQKPESPGLLFVNVGLLTVQGPLPKIASLASPKDLKAVDAKFPVHCFSLTHEDGRLTRHDKIERRLIDGSVFDSESAPQDLHLPGEPKLLHVRAEIPKNSFGSPVVNDEGRILGLYSDAVPKEKSQGIEHLHYVTMMTPELVKQVKLWLRDPNKARIWVPASPVATPPTTEKQP